MMLVLGGEGQLGREFARQAARAGVALVALGRRDADILDRRSIERALAAHKPSLIVHCAAYTAVDRAESEPEAAQAVNVDGSRIVGESARAADIPVVHFSTDYVFDGSKTGAYSEDDPVCPLGVYGRTKAEGERALAKAQPRSLILRTSWVYGVFGANFLKTMLRLARERDELRVVADQIGSPTSTQAIALATLAIAPRLQTGPADSLWGVYHLTGSGVTSWHGFAEAIVAAAEPALGRRPKVTAITAVDYPTPARRPVNSALDNARFRAAFGITTRAWNDDVRETVKLLTNEDA
jgi:dTDP-4-dehydrorhamnose reductase